jgi:hypothetical protein
MRDCLGCDGHRMFGIQERLIREYAETAMRIGAERERRRLASWPGSDPDSSGWNVKTKSHEFPTAAPEGCAATNPSPKAKAKCQGQRKQEPA